MYRRLKAAPFAYLSDERFQEIMAKSKAETEKFIVESKKEFSDALDKALDKVEAKSEIRRRETEERIAAENKKAEARLAADNAKAEARIAADRKAQQDWFDRTLERSEKRFSSMFKWLVATFITMFITMIGVFANLLISNGYLPL